MQERESERESEKEEGDKYELAHTQRERGNREGDMGKSLCDITTDGPEEGRQKRKEVIDRLLIPTNQLV